MQNPWDVRPRSRSKDTTSEAVFVKVGEALTHWEMLESAMAELFDAMVSSHPSNRAAFMAFVAVKSSSARTELLQAAFDRAIPLSSPARQEVGYLIESFGKFGARRNEIAHGRVYDLGEHGFALGPNNVMRHKWTPKGEAKYQYWSRDIEYYLRCFSTLREGVDAACTGLRQLTASRTKRTKSRQSEKDKRT